MIIFHILVCVWMCFCLAFPRQEPIFQPRHSSPTATSTGSPRLPERGWRALPLENQGAAPVCLTEWLERRIADNELRCCDCDAAAAEGKREGTPSSVLPAAGYLSYRKEKSDDASWEWEKGAKKQEESKVWGERMEEVRKKSRWKRCNEERKEEMAKYDEEMKMSRRII